MKAWRICSSKYASTAFSGIGNRKAGSRWVPEGVLVVYTSQSLSLAILENLVHMDVRHFPAEHIVIPVDIPDSIDIEEVEVESLPDDWQRFDDYSHLHPIGQDWVTRAESAILIVPSVVAPGESNFVINPEHPDFKKLVIGDPFPFEFDGRF